MGYPSWGGEQGRLGRYEHYSYLRDTDVSTYCQASFPLFAVEAEAKEVAQSFELNSNQSNRRDPLKKRGVPRTRGGLENPKRPKATRRYPILRPERPALLDYRNRNIAELVA